MVLCFSDANPSALPFISISIVLSLYGDEGHAPKRNVILSYFSCFLLSIRSFSHHGLKFCSLIEVTVCLVVCILIRLTSAFFSLFSFSFSFLSLSVSWCADQRLISQGCICHVRFPSQPRHEIRCQSVGAFIQSLTVPRVSRGQSHWGRRCPYCGRVGARLCSFSYMEKMELIP